MLEKLKLWLPLDPSDEAAILGLPHAVRALRAHEFIVREDDRPTHACLLLSGYAIRHKVAGNGGRQIFSIHMKGDVVDLHNAILRRADHHVEALTAMEVALIPVQAIREMATKFPQVGQAMWYETLVDAAIFREWTLNVGRRDARARTAHLLCEFAVRLEVAGIGKKNDYELPMTQDELGDALALSSVHISRTLKALAEEGLIERSKRAVRIQNFAGLARVGDFDLRYLHLDRALKTGAFQKETGPYRNERLTSGLDADGEFEIF
jgi:CRP-like cAMP-binding protein